MKLIRSLSIILGLFLALTTSLPGTVHAEAGFCDFGTKVDELKKIQTRVNPDDSLGVLAELKIRKDLLKISGGCLRKNAEDLDSQLSLVRTTTPEGKAFIEWIHRQIQENIGFYSYKETQIDTLGLKGAKDMAKEFAARKLQADDQLEFIIQSILDWNSNQVLFETGAKRFSDIKKTLDAFKLPADHEIIVLEKEAVAIFQEASLENQNAWKDFANHEVDAGREKTKSSLEKLAKAYTVFLEISEVSKKTLPL
ncbi:MAG: hypothetical protein AAB903_00900 [Patescibacteria group bacterium]